MARTITQTYSSTKNSMITAWETILNDALNTTVTKETVSSVTWLTIEDDLKIALSEGYVRVYKGNIYYPIFAGQPYSTSNIIQAIVSDSGDVFFKVYSSSSAIDSIPQDKADRFMLYKGVNSLDDDAEEKWCIMINYCYEYKSTVIDSAYMIQNIIAPDTTVTSQTVTPDGYNHNPPNIITATDERTGRALKGSWIQNAKTALAVPIASGESAYVSKYARLLAISPTCYYGSVMFNNHKYVGNGLWLLLDEEVT